VVARSFGSALLFVDRTCRLLFPPPLFMPQPKRALVTGAEGFIGTHLVAFLLERHWQVVAGHRSSDASFHVASGLETVQCDLADLHQVKRAIRHTCPTHIFHLAAESLPAASWQDPVLVFRANILASLHLFEAIRELPYCPVVVAACSGSEYGAVSRTELPVDERHPLRPLNPYALSKVCLDFLSGEYARQRKIPAVRLRLFNTTGPGKTGDAPSDFVRQLVRIRQKRQAPRIEVGNLKARRAFLHVNDAVRAFYLAAVRGKVGEAYNICGGQAVSMRKLLSSAIRLAGVKAEIAPVKALLRPTDEPTIWGDSTKFRKATGWKPASSLEQILSELIAYWDQRTEKCSAASA